MPVCVLGIYPIARTDGLGDWLTVIAQKPLVEARRAVNLFGGKKPMRIAEAPCAPVQQFVVECAKRDSVLFRVRTAGLMPFHVSGLKANWMAVETNVIATHGAAVLVGAQDSITEGRVARRALSAGLGGDIQAYSA